LDIPASRATNEWKKFQNLRDARKAIALALKKNPSIQTLNYDDSKIEVKRTGIDSKNEVAPAYTSSNSESIIFM
jgi:hypothetical protein